MTGRVADGLILQLADPDIIRWFVDCVREAAVAAGRDPDSSRSRPRRRLHVGDRATTAASGSAGSRRWSATTWSTCQQVPDEAAARVAHRHTSRPRGLRLSPPRRGGLDQRRVRERRDRRPLRDRRPARGAPSSGWRSSATRASTQFNVYLMNGDEEDQLDRYGAAYAVSSVALGLSRAPRPARR